MASSQKIVDFITDQIARAGQIRYRKMFGEYAIYCRDKVVALVCDDKLFVKNTAAGREYIINPQEELPYPGAKPYFLIDEERWDDHEWLSGLVLVTEKALPMPLVRHSQRKIKNT